MAVTVEAKEFLAKCEEELKDRFTEKDEEFMKVFNLEKPVSPILEPWWVPNNQGRRNDRRNNRRHHPYERHGNQDNRDKYDRRENDQHDRRDRDHQDRRGYSDYNRDNTGHSGYHQRSRYY